MDICDTLYSHKILWKNKKIQPQTYLRLTLAAFICDRRVEICTLLFTPAFLMHAGTLFIWCFVVLHVRIIVYCRNYVSYTLLLEAGTESVST